MCSVRIAVKQRSALQPQVLSARKVTLCHKLDLALLLKEPVDVITGSD